jgi:hypothetical protein
MKQKKGKTVNPAEPSSPLLVDEEVFTDIITKMVNTSPLPLKDVPRRKNPETDPRHMPVFDFSHVIRIDKSRKK